MCAALYPVLRSYQGDAGNVIAASAEGYAFPTNLDRDQPVDGLSPPSQADILWSALDESWTSSRLCSELAEHNHRRTTEPR